MVINLSTDMNSQNQPSSSRAANPTRGANIRRGNSRVQPGDDIGQVLFQNIHRPLLEQTEQRMDLRARIQAQNPTAAFFMTANPTIEEEEHLDERGERRPPTRVTAEQRAAIIEMNEEGYTTASIAGTLVLRVSAVYKVLAGNALGNAAIRAAADGRRHANETAVKARIAEILDADLTINVEELTRVLRYERLRTSAPTVKSWRIGAFQNYRFSHFGPQTGTTPDISEAKSKATVAALKKADEKPRSLVVFVSIKLLTGYFKVYGAEGDVQANARRLPESTKVLCVVACNKNRIFYSKFQVIGTALPPLNPVIVELCAALNGNNNLKVVLDYYSPGWNDFQHAMQSEGHSLHRLGPNDSWFSLAESLMYLLPGRLRAQRFFSRAQFRERVNNPFNFTPAELSFASSSIIKYSSTRIYEPRSSVPFPTGVIIDRPRPPSVAELEENLSEYGQVFNAVTHPYMLYLDNVETMNNAAIE